METSNTKETILVTGATGYIGGRLVPRLLDAGYPVRCMVRDPTRLQGRQWRAQVEVISGDCLDISTLPVALRGVDVAYYLIHSMGDNPDFEERDIQAAKNFGAVAKAEGVQRIIYLGGLGDSGQRAFAASPFPPGDRCALRESGVPVTEFRAAVIVGSGSMSFEIIRYLTERVPVMICPRWVYTQVQPIAIRNVLDYLSVALNTPGSIGRIIEIGGMDVMNYGEMLTGYARVGDCGAGSCQCRC